jgi:hypothetical protein
MLHNPKWTKTSPTLKGLIAWLKKQDPSVEYDHEWPWACAIGLYAQSIGRTYGTLLADYRQLQRWDESIAESLPHTFGAALERAKTFVE